MKYTDEQRIMKILEHAKSLMQFISKNQIDKQMLIDNLVTQWTVTTPLFQIGEHVYYLSPEFKQAHNEIKWHAISGLRHRLVHDCDDTNWNLIVDIVFEDIPLLITQVETIIKEGCQNE